MNLYNALQLQNGQIPTPLPRSLRDVNNNENNQVGLVNANAQANLNLSVFNSGAAAAGTSLAGVGAAAASTVTTTTVTATGIITTTKAVGAAAVVPVVGQVVAVVAAIVSVAQMIDTADKQKRWQSAINQKQNQIALIQQEVTTDLAVAEYSIQLLRDEIAAREDVLKTNRILLIGSVTVLAVAGMVMLYLVNKNKK